MQSALSFKVGLTSSLWAVEWTERVSNAVGLNPCHPSTAIAHRAAMSRRVVALKVKPVLLVLGMSRVAKISNAIVGLDAVPMVDFITNRPRPVRVKPGKSMLRVLVPLNRDASVTLVHVTRSLAGESMLATHTDLPNEPTRFWVVVQHLAQTLNRQHRKEPRCPNHSSNH